MWRRLRKIKPNLRGLQAELLEEDAEQEPLTLATRTEYKNKMKSKSAGEKQPTDWQARSFNTLSREYNIVDSKYATQ